MTAQPDLLRSARFRLEREASWKRLDALVTKTERLGAAGLSYDEARDLATCYRQAMNSLSVARDISLDLALLTYLERLCARAYLVVYAPQASLRGLMAALIRDGIPQAVRRSAVPLFIGFLAMIGGFGVGYLLFQQDPSWYFSFVPPSLSDGRTPAASAEYLRQSLYDGASEGSESLGVFASFLFTHNTRVAILVFALGIFLSVPSFLLTFYNGLLLGAFYGMFAAKGLGYDLFAWLSIHGVTEISAICFACAGGARIGLSVLMPGDLTRRESLRLHGRDAVKLMVLAGLMLIVAAFIEGFLRQWVQSPDLRLLIGWGFGAGWLAWLTLSGSRA
jgi:uncharacterized membrane protein SpoIIM required for sporulation